VVAQSADERFCRRVIEQVDDAVGIGVEENGAVAPSPTECESRSAPSRRVRVKIAGPIVYRERGFCPGREIYFLDPTGNVLELRDPTWKPGMPTPTFEEITAKRAAV
jgi:hypothetical protein